MAEKLVSIITPCYNGADYVHRLLDSILNQTYTNIEFIFVNDGSTDDTERVVLEYKPKFEAKGYSFIYIYQDNAGQSAALNKGLKIFSGDYLTWPDSDDYYSSHTAIGDRIHFLELNESCSVIYTNGALVSEEGCLIGCFKNESFDYETRNIFMDCLLERSFWYCPIAFIFRSSVVKSTIKDLSIYESRGGQNWQMMLPVFFENSVKYVDLLDFVYLVRSNSHSRHNLDQLECEINRRNEHKRIILNTIERMFLSSQEKQKLVNITENKYIRIMFNLYTRCNQMRKSYFYYSQIVDRVYKDHFKMAACCLHLYSIFRKIRGVVRK